MSELDNYCNVCGQELNEIDDIDFDSITGKRNKRKICSSGACGHYGIPHKFESIRGTGGWLVGPDYKCKICGCIG
jgi:hypothetical protein